MFSNPSFFSTFISELSPPTYPASAHITAPATRQRPHPNTMNRPNWCKRGGEGGAQPREAFVSLDPNVSGLDYLQVFRRFDAHLFSPPC
ncbi:hypothetical protein D9619_006217 [Psilocybe cf. subviscida]|uniref:Uncharacterized protein n=1 Tax=Psilocybe cf. subviscida TaxID=2480587 RepID=A0A8H5B4Y4_9AGAR|nr:hypothetical protein D9619_006217 [Psilocybe cf. subviscida]